MIPFLDLLKNKEAVNLRFIWLVYFFVLLVMSLYFSGSSGSYDSIFIGIESILSKSPYWDPKYFLTAAIDISKNGWIGSDNDWIFNLWPPGFAVLEAAIIKIFGDSVPLLFILQICASLLYASVSLLLFIFLNKRFNLYISLIVPLLIFLIPFVRVFLLGQYGVSLGETFSIGIFLLFIMLSLIAFERKSIGYSLLAGLALGMSTYFRSYFETIQMFVSISGLVIVGILLLLIFMNKFIRSKNEFKNLARIIFFIFFISNLIMLPWRLYHLKYQDNLKWVGTADLMFANQLKSPNTFVGEGEWLYIGGANTACRVDSSICDMNTTNAKNVVIHTWLHNPLKWYNIKFEIIDKYWFSDIDKWGAPSNDYKFNLSNIVNAVILILMILSVLLMSRSSLSKNIVMFVGWVYFSLLLSYSAIFSFAHFEVRYFYFPKIVIVYIFIILLANLKRKEKKLK